MSYKNDCEKLSDEQFWGFVKITAFIGLGIHTAFSFRGGKLETGENEVKNK